MIGVLGLVAGTLFLCVAYLSGSGSLLGVVNDFVVEALPPLRHLYDGRVEQFFTTAPGYVGALMVGSPFAFAAMGLRGSWQMIYFASALPCLAACPLLMWWLDSRVGTELAVAGRTWLILSPLSLLLLINPVFIFSILLGHPEELLCGALSIAAVVQAGRGRATWSMLLVGLAIDAKPWAIVVAPVALAVLPRLRVRDVVVLIGVIAAFYAPVMLIQGTGTGNLGGVSGSQIFMTTELWWWFGSVSWFALHSHEILVVAGWASCAAWWLIRGRRLNPDTNRVREGLLLLALVLLLRSSLDTWNNIYYQLPFLLTIYALELGRPPRISALLTIALTAVTVRLHLYTADVRAVAYDVVIVPLLLALILRLFSPRRWTMIRNSLLASRGARQHVPVGLLSRSWHWATPRR